LVCSGLKGFATNSIDWLLSCVISHESLQTLELTEAVCVTT